jgi:beta-lactam-binding protein with PASTA domain
MNPESMSGSGGLFLKVKSMFRLFNRYITTNSKLIIRNVIFILLIFIVVFGIVTTFVFWFIRKGPPEVTVPNITGTELMDGLLILQKKKLNAIIDPRYFSEYEQNIVVEQDPKAGSIVREGKDIKLIVSKGPIVSIVEDYTGKTIAYVQNRLQEIFSFQGKTIKLGATTFVTSEEPQGTIIGQFPPPNTPITNVDTIDLVISAGKEIKAFKLADLAGEKITDVMELLALRGVLVSIITEDIMDPSQNGLIISHDPPAETLIEKGDTITFVVGYLPSERDAEKLYARVLNFDVPEELEMAEIRVVVADRIGEREIYNAENIGGDSISVPFKSYSNTTVYIYIEDGVYEVRKME